MTVKAQLLLTMILVNFICAFELLNRYYNLTVGAHNIF